MAFDRDKQILDFIDKSSRVLICFNSQYTIDSTASALLMAHYLKYKGKEYTIVCDGFESKEDHQLFTPEIESINTTMESPQRFMISLDMGKCKIKEFSYDVDGSKLHIFVTPEKGYLEHNKVQATSDDYVYDLIITIDSPDFTSLGRIYSEHTQFFYDVPIINIDHMAENENYGQINFVDSTAVSVSEMLYSFFKKHEKEFLQKEHYTTALAGIIYKTGSFRNSTVTPRSLHIASELVEKGAEKDAIVKHLYQRKDLATMKLWGKLLSRLSKTEEGKIIYSYVTKEELKGVTIDAQAILDIIEELLVHIPGAETILLTYEREEDSYHHIVWTSSHLNSMELVKKFNPRLIKKLAYFKIQGKSLEAEQKKVLESISQSITAQGGSASG